MLKLVNHLKNALAMRDELEDEAIDNPFNFESKNKRDEKAALIREDLKEIESGWFD